jgi:hypothetical protein
MIYTMVQPIALDPDATIAALSDTCDALDDLAAVPASSGLYAWWAPPAVFEGLPGPAHPHTADFRLLYVGIAANLRRRSLRDHLRRSGRSTLRRTLAGLMLDTDGYQTHRTDRVVLVPGDEVRLTAWMQTHLLVSWFPHPAPRDVEAAVIERWAPPLHVTHASGPARDIVAAARRAHNTSA